MPVDPTLVALLAASAFFGALVSSFSGFAYSPVAAMFLVAVLPPSTLIPLLMICSILVRVTAIAHVGRTWNMARCAPMLLAGAAGVAIAVALLPLIDARHFRIGFGLFLASYALIMLRGLARHLGGNPSPQVESAVGLVGGIVGGLTAMPGAIPVLYCNMRGLPKNEQRGIVEPFILVMQVFALVMLLAAGQLDREIVAHVILTLPALGFGTAAGLLLYGRASDRQFRQIVLALLFVTGLGSAAAGEVGSILQLSETLVASLR